LQAQYNAFEHETQAFFDREVTELELFLQFGRKASFSLLLAGGFSGLLLLRKLV
tara:strand:+ start:2935 stop:3096 length:162 start_codon:yes stop_codon:yes gene_type:complete